MTAKILNFPNKNIPKVDATLSRVMDRNGSVNMEEDKKELRKLFKPLKRTPKDLNLNGNFRVYFPQDGGAPFIDNTEPNEDAIPLSEMISSHLLLYRTIATFNCGIHTQSCDYYKVNWAVLLKHKSGAVIGIAEWKGTPILWTESGKVTGDLLLDIRYLFKILCDPSLTIDYDGTIAGSQA